MGYTSWHTYGYGICVSDIGEASGGAYPELAGNGTSATEKYPGMDG